MLLSGREPQDRSERMIANNYRALQYVRDNKSDPITASRVVELQKILTDGTLDESDGAGRFRRADEHIVIEDETGTLLRDPSAARELSARLDRLCDFANGGGTTYTVGFSQATDYSDAALAAPASYHIVMTYTASAAAV